MSNTADLIKQLEELNRTNAFSVFIPSLKKEIKIKNLNLKQQKALLKTSIDETLTKLSFISSFYSIIQENVLDNINISDLYTFDRTAIAIALRAHSLDATYSYNDKKINLLDKVNEFTNIKTDIEFDKKIEFNGFTVELAAPKLGVDKNISEYSFNTIKTLEDKDFKNIIGELFVHELVKFIKSVSIMGDKPFSLEASNTKISEIIYIVERFPSTLTSKILEYVKSYRDLEAKFTNVGDINIEVDGAFFSI